MQVPRRATVLFLAVFLGVGLSGPASADVDWGDYMEGEGTRPPPVRAASGSDSASEDWSSSAAPNTTRERPGKKAKRTKVAKRGKGKGKAKAKRRAARRAARR